MMQLGKWMLGKEIGSGGQGTVFLAWDGDLRTQVNQKLAKKLNNLKIWGESEIYSNIGNIIADLQLSYQLAENTNQYALKQLHPREKARDNDLAEERIRNEIDAMSALNHPGIIQIVDKDKDYKWYVSPFYQGGTLKAHMGVYKGDALGSLTAIKPLVQAVAEIHAKNIVHRDIKPENVFIAANNNLVLGDFGLVYFADQNRTRMSRTFENVGSRDWMPAWAYGQRIEDVRPSFDVFSLGKILYSMVSGRPMLPLWYYDRPEYSISNIVSKQEDAAWINSILAKTVVEHENDCLESAKDMLELIDDATEKIKTSISYPGQQDRRCVVCGEGTYRKTIQGNPGDLNKIGISPVGGQRWRAFVCTKCSNVQLFSKSESNQEDWIF